MTAGQSEGVVGRLTLPRSKLPLLELRHIELARPY